MDELNRLINQCVTSDTIVQPATLETSGNTSESVCKCRRKVEGIARVSPETFPHCVSCGTSARMTDPVSRRHRRNSAELAQGAHECLECHQPTDEPRNGLCVACYHRHRRAVLPRSERASVVNCRCCQKPTSKPRFGACYACYLRAWRSGAPLVERRSAGQGALPLAWGVFGACRRAS